jgi:hypothetical protein
MSKTKRTNGRLAGHSGTLSRLFPLSRPACPVLSPLRRSCRADAVGAQPGGEAV